MIKGTCVLLRHTIFVILSKELKYMVSNLLQKYLWLANVIYQSNGITFEQINNKWLTNDLSEGLELPKRTFHKWRIAVEELFGIIIDCDRKNGYRFFVHEKECLCGNSLTGWLFSTLSVGYKLESHKSIKDRILLEDVSTDNDWLLNILEALHHNIRLSITYKSFNNDRETTFEVEPYCLKMFLQRWYLVARNVHFENPRIYALDRIVNLRQTNTIFNYPKDFSPKQFFGASYGIIVDDSMDAENVELKVDHSQVGYVRSLPLHHSQQEMEQESEYSIFRLKLTPTFDFEQKILSMGEYVEVISPRWLRERIINRVTKIKQQYI